MPTLETTLRNALADAIDTAVNSGTGTATFKFETTASAAVATINLQDPAFGAAATGTITLQGVTLSDTSAAGGTVAQASIYNKSGTKQLQLTVATTGQDVDLSDLVINAGEQVDLTALTITVPA